jgi:protein N-lysine methyltransferase METTL21D
MTTSRNSNMHFPLFAYAMRRTKSTGAGPLPAHATKHEKTLHYPFLDVGFNLMQLDNGISNGTGLWLGGQCLALYLAAQNNQIKREVLTARGKGSKGRANQPVGQKLRCIELGSGVGLTA